MKKKKKSLKSKKIISKKISKISLKKKAKPATRKKKKVTVSLKKRISELTSPRKKTPIFSKSPNILLEASQKIQTSKFDLGQAIEEKPKKIKLPQRYFDNRIVLLSRDPWWLHTYWDISKEKEEEVLSKIPQEERKGLKKILRVYDVTGIENFTGLNAKDFFDVEINNEACNWYINANKPESSFCVDIGFLSGKSNFFLLSRSNIVNTPYFGISDLLDEEWALPEEEYSKILGIYDLGKSSLERRRKFQQFFRRQVSSQGISGLFSPGFKKKIKRGFFLEVYTELILYGKTQPDAKLTLKGKIVKLRKDGTFNFRFALPEGKFEFPIEATSSSGKDKIKITPVVERTQK